MLTGYRLALAICNFSADCEARGHVGRRAWLFDVDPDGPALGWWCVQCTTKYKQEQIKEAKNVK